MAPNCSRRQLVAFRWLALAISTLLLTGCGQLLQLRDDIREGKSAYTWVRGSVESPTCLNCPTILVALGDTSGKRVLSYRVYEKPSDFVLPIPIEAAHLLAFNDLNGDFEYQPDEPAVWHDLTRESGNTPGREPIRLTMRQPSSAIPSSLDLGNLFELRGTHPGLIEMQLGTETTLDAPLFDADLAGLGMWQPVHFMKSGHAGIYFLEPYTPHKTPVLFIHGIGGSPRDFATMINSLDRQKFQPWLLYYPSGLELTATSSGMLGLLSALHLRYQFDELHLIAHSMGGLVSRGYLSACERLQNCRYLRSFTSISSPFGGDPAAQEGVERSPIVMPVWKSLSPASRFLKNLFARPLPHGVPHHMVFGYHNTSRVRAESSDGTIRLNSQLRPEAQLQATSLFGFDEDHTSILDNPELHARIGRILHHPIGNPQD